MQQRVLTSQSHKLWVLMAGVFALQRARASWCQESFIGIHWHLVSQKLWLSVAGVIAKLEQQQCQLEQFAVVACTGAGIPLTRPLDAVDWRF